MDAPHRHGDHHRNIVNVGDVPLRIATAHAPRGHADGTVHRTKAGADQEEHDD